jgi:hypothetical protein
MRSLFFAMVVTAIPASAQPVPISCNGQTCTFTLNFDDGYAHLANIIGAPYSGQIQHSNSQTLPNGTHMSNQSSGPVIYRDSKGRVRTERHADPTANGRPARPDDFVIAEIHDPVAGFEYVLDPVDQVAHRRPFKPESSWKWDPSQIANMPTQPYGGPVGPNSTVQFLGTRTISGVLAYGQKTTWTRTTPGGETITQAEEEWLDPASGALLSSVSGTNGNDQTLTLANYSNAEPAPSLFQVPGGYQTVDETGSFQIVHQRVAPGPNGTGTHGPQLTGSCEEGVCRVNFDPGNAPANFAVTGAPYSGHQVFTSVSSNGTPFSASPNGTGQYRDSHGRVRTDPKQVSVRAAGPGNMMPPLVEIEDPVAGFFYILNPASQTAYRLKAAFRSVAFQPNQNMAQQAGTRTGPNGSTVTIENLGQQIISGVTATGQRTTNIYPPGTYSQNDKEIVTVNERWIDPKTGVVILMKNAGLRVNTTDSIPDYQEGDPEASLFQIPSGYTIVDETGPFTFTAPVH